MPLSSSQIGLEKQLASAEALRFVESGMRLGIGTGSTVAPFIKLLGERVRTGELKVQGVATSHLSQELAIAAGIPMLQPSRSLVLDLAIDGADEIGPGLALVKGGGGALLREKIVAAAARKFIVIADASKLVKQLGKFPLPLEVIPFASPWVMDRIQELGANPVLRTDKTDPTKTALTDQGNWLLDCHFEQIPDPEQLTSRLERIPGIVEHGLFLGMAQGAFIADGNQVSFLRPDGSTIVAEGLRQLP
jgi:ribose 5-phosphate isomerase A